LARRRSPTQLSLQAKSRDVGIAKQWRIGATDAAEHVNDRRNEKEIRMSNVSVIDGIGFAAAGLVLATFCMRSMSALRWMAIASNLAFIAYGYLGHLVPVLLLHVLLLPVNVYRVTQLCGGPARSGPAGQRRSVRLRL
jgi:hypothetical protein